MMARPRIEQPNRHAKRRNGYLSCTARVLRRERSINMSGNKGFGVDIWEQMFLLVQRLKLRIARV